MGGIHSYFGPLQLRGLLLFQFYGFSELFESNFANRHFLRVAFWSKKASFRWIAIDGRNSVRFPLDTIRKEFRFSNFTALRGILKSNFPNRHFRRVAFFGKTSISTDRQRWAEFSQIPLVKLRWIIDFRILRGYRKKQFQNHHFRCVEFWRKRRFRWIANGGLGGNSVIFPPATITRDFHFANFTVLRGF